MKQSLLRTVLRREMVGLARVTVIVLAVFLFLLEFGYSTDTATGLLLDQLRYGLVIAAGFVMKRIVEFGPSEDQLTDPRWIDEQHRPQFLLVSAQRV